MDAQTILSSGTVAISLVTAVVVLVTNLWNLRAAAATRAAAERAESRAEESLRKSEQNANTLSRVATAKQLNGQLTEYRRLVQLEADARIRAAEIKAEKAFVEGMEAQRSSEPVATAAAVADLKQLVVEAVQTAEPVATAASVAEIKQLVVEASQAAADAASDKPPGETK